MWSLNYPAHFRQSLEAFQLARRLGRVGIIGQPPTDEVKIPYRQAMFRALTVSFSYSSKYTSWERVLSLFERGAIRPSQFISARPAIGGMGARI